MHSFELYDRGARLLMFCVAAAGDAQDLQIEQESWLVWILGALGWTYSVVFLALSVCLVALLVVNFLGLRREIVVPRALVRGVRDHLGERRYQQAYELAKFDDSMLGRVLSAGMRQLGAGREAVVEAMHTTGDEESMGLEHRLSYLGIIATISPMIGLLGTVQGMIASFRIIAVSGVTPEPAELAEGISTALFTTFVGLAITIPALSAYNILRNRLAKLALEVGIVSDGLLRRLAANGS